MSNWQNILVGLIVLAAIVYVVRRALTRLRAFRSSRSSASCATGCGGCGESPKASTTPRTVFVEIGRSKKSHSSSP